MLPTKPPNGKSHPTGEQAVALAKLAQALGAGSTKLREALHAIFGEHDDRHVRAAQIDGQLQPLVSELLQAQNPTNPI